MCDNFHILGEEPLEDESIELKPFYCPFCRRDLIPTLLNGLPLYIHDEVTHPFNFNMLDYEVMH